MKINDPSSVQVAPSTTSRVAQGSGAKDGIEPQDKVSVPTSQESAALAAAQTAMASGRAERVQQIISAVKNGQYYPSPQQIANQLVSDAEISARLALMLKT